MNKKRTRKNICILLCVAFILAFSAVPTYAIESENSVPFASFYTARIMQGNTQSASDCKETYDCLISSGSYTSGTISNCGWYVYSNGTYGESANRVTSSQFLSASNYDIAYYSGHGSSNSSGPSLNVHATYTYGTYTPFNVASLLGVSGSNWQTSCEWSTSDPIQVLILAACNQLTSYGAMYYARVMKASDLRVVTGYQDTAPSDGDDNIAADFFAKCESGYSVRYSWQYANQNHYAYPDWAVLAYSGTNGGYIMPGYTDTYYPPPSASTSILKYSNGGSSSLTLSSRSPASIPTMPPALYINVSESNTDYTSFIREPVSCDSNIDLNLSTTNSMVLELLDCNTLATKISSEDVYLDKQDFNAS